MNRLILAEYKKIFFSKFSRRYLLVLVVAGVAFGVVLSLTTRMTTGRHLNELAPHEVLSMNMLGVDLASIMLIAFAAMCVHREFSTKSIQASLRGDTGTDALVCRETADVLGLVPRHKCRHGFPGVLGQSAAPGDERHAAGLCCGGDGQADVDRGHGHARVLLLAHRVGGFHLLERRRSRRFCLGRAGRTGRPRDFAGRCAVLPLARGAAGRHSQSGGDESTRILRSREPAGQCGRPGGLGGGHGIDSRLEIPTARRQAELLVGLSGRFHHGAARMFFVSAALSL